MTGTESPHGLTFDHSQIMRGFFRPKSHDESLKPQLQASPSPPSKRMGVYRSPSVSCSVSVGTKPR